MTRRNICSECGRAKPGRKAAGPRTAEARRRAKVEYLRGYRHARAGKPRAEDGAEYARGWEAGHEFDR